MSHSQFHSTNLFILRHAWLNLWDKHMTTGRINQVTTFPITDTTAMSTKLLGRPKSHLSFSGSSSPSQISNPLASKPRSPHSATDGLSDHKVKSPCSPISHWQGRIASCLLQQKSWPSERTTCDWQNNMLCGSPSHGGFSSVLTATSLAIGK